MSFVSELIFGLAEVKETQMLRPWTLAFASLAFLHANPAAFAASSDEHWEGFSVLPPEGRISALATSGSSLYVAGSFTSIGGVQATNVAKWDGAKWRPLGDGIIGAYIPAIVVRENSVYVGGYISRAGNVEVSGVAKWDGADWSSLGAGVAGVVSAMAFVGNDLFAGGSFHLAGATAATNIARWDGTNWAGVGGGVTRWSLCDPLPLLCEDGVVRAMAVRGKSLFVAGSFTMAGGKTITNIAEWNGRDWLALGPGMPGNNEGVNAIAIQDNRVYAGGNLRWIPGVIGPGVAVWDGSIWSAIANSNFEGARALVFNGTDLFVGPGQNETIAARGIAMWDGYAWSALGSGIDGAAFILVANGSDLFVAGSFSMAGGKPASGLAVWHIPHALNAVRVGNALRISWPGTGTNFVLEAKESLCGANWSEVAQPPYLHDNECVVTESINGPSKFYLLRRK